MKYPGTPVMVLDAPSQQELINAITGAGLCAVHRVPVRDFSSLPADIESREFNDIHEECEFTLRSTTQAKCLAIDAECEPETMAAATVLCMAAQFDMVLLCKDGQIPPMMLRQMIPVSGVEDTEKALSLIDMILKKRKTENRRMQAPLVSPLFLEMEPGADEDNQIEMLVGMAREKASLIEPTPSHIMLHALASIPVAE